MASDEKRVDLVFEGGGVKGIGLGGAFGELMRRGFQPQCVAGTSAGAITAALVAAGYTGEELERVVLHEMRFSDFMDESRLDRLGAPGRALSILREKGIYEGEYFLDWMRQRLQHKQCTTFGQLRNDDVPEGDPRRYRLQVIASDLTERSMLVLPRDAPRLGLEPDELEIALAVRMSMSIPIFFEPVQHTNPKTGNEHLIVDGGMLSNFPVWLFDCGKDAEPAWPTFGLLLVAPGQATPLLSAEVERDDRRASITDFLKALMQTATEAHDRLYVEQANYARTIPIPTRGVHTTEFNITPERAQALFDSGRQAATDFLATWNFETYKAAFRKQEPAARRAALLASAAP